MFSHRTLLASGMVLLAVGMLSLTSCGPTPLVPVVTSPTTETAAQSPWFEDVTEHWGIDFVQQPGPTAGYPMPQINGTGVAVFDADGDGRLDLYFLNGSGDDSGHPNRLLRQREEGGFEDVSAGSGLDVCGVCTGVAVGDVNNDGRPDVLVGFADKASLMLNQGHGKFEDITMEARIDNPNWATSATFFDFDRDGWLDLFIANYVVQETPRECQNPDGQPDYCPPFLFAGSSGRLFRNLSGQADGKVRFEDVTITAGIELPGPALGVLTADFIGDSWPDLLVANDAEANRLWVNQRNGTFIDEAAERGVAMSLLGKPEGNMGIAYNDADGDGLADLFITHLNREQHTLWRQSPRGQFVDRTGPAEIAKEDMRGTGFGTIMEDFDHDGDVDVAIANGRVVKGPPANAAELGDHFAQYAETNHLFENDGHGRFSNVSAMNTAFCSTPGVYRGLGCGDLDGDGAIDFVVSGIGGSARVLRNVAGDRGHWLMVRAIDPASNRDAFGAEVTLRSGGKSWLRRVQSDGSYQSASSPVVHFGLGDRTQFDAIEILWPDGTRETFPGGKSNRSIECRKGNGDEQAEGTHLPKM